MGFIVESSLDRNVGKEPTPRTRNDQTLGVAQSASDHVLVRRNTDGCTKRSKEMIGAYAGNLSHLLQRNLFLEMLFDKSNRPFYSGVSC
jgi:hypothetical protein